MTVKARAPRLLRYGGAFLCYVWMGAIASGAMIVRFDQDEYVVSGPNESFEVQILFDGDSDTPEIEPPTTDLFSYGAEVRFEPLDAEVTGTDKISTPAEIDYFGFDDSALRQVEPGVAATKGNVSLTNDPTIGYGESWLASVTLTNLAAAPDVYLIELAPFITLGPNEELFVDVNGAVLDSEISFGTARVRVVPEPLGLSWLLPAFCISERILRRRRRVERS